MNARQYQSEIATKLRKVFPDVALFWPPTQTSSNRYSPRVDVAVGPFNLSSGDKREKIKKDFFSQVNKSRLGKFCRQLDENPNPRCALAIEIVFSGSSKRILGDLANTSLMGLYGLVVADDKQLKKAERVYQYVKTAKSGYLFSNVAVLSRAEFNDFLKQLR